MSEATNSRKLKFLHCSDIHLDTPYTGLTPEKAEERRRELRTAFTHMIDFVRDRDVDYCLISGDLFDTQYATNTTAEILIREFRSCPNTKFIIAPGRHDCLEHNPIYLSGRLPKNCYLFEKDTLSRFDFPEDKVVIYGWAFLGENITESPLYDRQVDDGSMINIVCGYADLDGELGSDMAPLSKSDIAKFGADYYALGSHHEKTDFIKCAGSMYSYCGSLQCTGFEEPYVGGVKLLNVEYDSGELSIDAKSVSFGYLRFVTEVIDINGVDSNNEITNRISKMVNEKGYGHETALRVVFTGNVDPRFVVPKNLECDAFGLYYFNVIDKTLPLHNTEHFKRDMSCAGEMYRRLLPMMTSKEESDRLTAAYAFRVGLAALENRDIEI